MNPPIRLLHLSDIHFKAGKLWDQDPVLGALARFIAGEVKGGLIPDLVAITGDLAFAGTAEEYGPAKHWLEQQLWPALPVDFPRDHLLLVPGNHDVDRNRVSKGARSIQDTLLAEQSQDTIADLLKDSDERDILLKRHTAYLGFLGGWLGQRQLLPWWQRVIVIRGTRLHVARLDSAWMPWGNEDRNHLLLGRYQLNQTVVTKDADDAVWRIALLHHPLDYLLMIGCLFPSPNPNPLACAAFFKPRSDRWTLSDMPPARGPQNSWDFIVITPASHAPKGTTPSDTRIPASASPVTGPITPKSQEGHRSPSRNGQCSTGPQGGRASWVIP